MMGGAKQVINDYIDEQPASQAEWLADKGIIQAKDEATGQILTPEELGERYRGNPTLPLADNESAGAEAVQSFVGYEAALLVLQASFVVVHSSIISAQSCSIDARCSRYSALL